MLTSAALGLEGGRVAQREARKEAQKAVRSVSEEHEVKSQQDKGEDEHARSLAVEKAVLIEVEPDADGLEEKKDDVG